VSAEVAMTLDAARRPSKPSLVTVHKPHAEN
jgi:hypothetical protein